ncbi:hypothetical protein KCU81_g7080, partial [Aureobasidium melanogenum]|uniref:glutathione transferase n=1 Tax=Aureobasidium melanogenum (strain CBS 110374) TaxID=1043003 RepID=A0A074VUA3_AURM1
MTIRLHRSKLSTCTQRVMLVLNGLDLPYNLIDVDIGQGEHEGFVHDIHPFGKLPAVEDGTLHVFESRAICKYLVAFSDSVLLSPVDSRELAALEQAALVEHSYFNTSFSKLACERIFEQWMMSQLPPTTENFKEVLDHYEKLLASQPYLTKCSRVDMNHLAWLHTLSHLSMEHEISSRGKVAAWYQRMQQRPAWQKVLSGITA